MEELGDDLFGILVDESGDVSNKEQMMLVLRYVNGLGNVIERFLGVAHVPRTSSMSLKSALEYLLLERGLSVSRIRGQGYDGASNMHGEFGGLKTLILRENESAYYVHCFAHQLQLTLVGTLKNHIDVIWFFDVVSDVLNVVGSSCKRQDILREMNAIRVAKTINNGEMETGTGLNQELGLKRPDDTRCGSHYRSLLNLVELHPDVYEVLEFILRDYLEALHKMRARILMAKIITFDYAFILYLMLDLLGITNNLSQVLQKADQDIVNTMDMVEACKQRIQVMRDRDFEELLEKVYQFCCAHNIDNSEMNANYVAPGRPQRRAPQITYLHHYHVDVLNEVIDLQLQELNNCFNEISSEFLKRVACLSPKDSFHAFDMSKLEKIAEFYPYEFDVTDIRVLFSELKNYNMDVRHHDEFQGLVGIKDLSRVMVETQRHCIYSSVYLLIKLALILPVATASVERAFSAMKYVKSKLRNKMAHEFLNDSLVTYVERDVCDSISSETIMDRFQNMKVRRGELP